MSLIENIDRDIKNAMLAKERDKLDALRAVKNALLVQRTEKGGSGTIDSETEIKILKRLVKQRKEAADLYLQQNRKDLADAELFQAGIIEAYLPDQVSEEAVREILEKIIRETGASGMKDMGKVMGQAARELAGKADNKLISDMVKQLLA